MTLDSKKSIIEQDFSLSPVYGKSVDNETNDWVEISGSTELILINNIYVQTPSLDSANLLLNLDIDQEILAKMAADPEIQNEIRLINQEFAETEEDGLSNQV